MNTRLLTLLDLADASRDTPRWQPRNHGSRCHNGFRSRVAPKGIPL